MTRARLIVFSGIGAGLALVGLANAHLVYVAFASQPGCMRHVQQGEGDGPRGVFSAAQSSCQPAKANRSDDHG